MTRLNGDTDQYWGVRDIRDTIGSILRRRRRMSALLVETLLILPVPWSMGSSIGMTDDG